MQTQLAVAGRTINWSVVIWMALTHAGALLALIPFAFSWSGLILCVILHWVTGGLGICLCYHRLLTHRSFRLVKPLEYLFTFCGDIAAQGGALEWVGKHRMHHQFSDTEGDPHTPNDGHWWSHMFWLFSSDEQSEGPRMWNRYVPDLLKDPVHRVLHHLRVVSPLAIGVVLYVAGYLIHGHMLAFSWVVWGVFLRMVLVYHSTWFVNWASHVWGYRNFETTDRSRNLWWVALVTYGEGWHNNHHAFQRSAAHGLRWWEFDVTYWTIRLLALFGLARDIQLPVPASALAKGSSPPILPSSVPTLGTETDLPVLQ